MAAFDIQHSEPELRYFGVRDELVADAADGQQVARACGFLLDVLPQARDEVIDGARVGVLAQVPHVFEHALARHGLAFVLHEIAQQVGLHQRQRVGLARAPAAPARRSPRSCPRT